jgi:DNA-binding CsgD family transcriptional regulator
MVVTAQRTKDQFLLGFLGILNRAVQVPWHDVVGHMQHRFPRVRVLAAQASLGADGHVVGWETWDSAAMGRASASTHDGVGADGVAYDETMAAADPLLRARAAGPGIFRPETILSHEELSSRLVHRRLLQPGGLVHGIVLYLGTDRIVDGVLQLWRTASEGAWSAEEFEALRELVDPLCDAIARDRDHRAALEGQLTTLLDALDAGAICVDGKGDVLHSNPHAPAVENGTTGDGQARLPRELESGVLGFLGSQVKERVRELEVQLAQERMSCVVHRLSNQRGRHPAALVLFPSAPQPNRIQELRRQFGLTPREGDVLVAVIRGHRNAEIASKLSLSEYTVKGHLKRIFQKLGVRSRSGAVAKVMGLEMALDDPRGE